MQSFDVIINGGGMVGSAAALGLSKAGLKVAIIEKQLPQEFSHQQAPDLRVSAISAASEHLLTEYGAWEFIRTMRTCVYRRLAVWENSSCRTEFNASDLNAGHLGHIIENRVVQLGLHQVAASHNNIHWFTQAHIKHIEDNDKNVITLSDGNILTAPLLIGADGAQSVVRDVAGIGVQGWQYKQQVLAIGIRTQGPQDDITWQQFSPSGPMAYLPLYDGFASLIWYNSADEVKRLKSLSLSKLKEQVKQHFPDELVEFDILNTASFPLTRMHANRYFQGQTVLLGDAAHTINPLAGQGVNLGFKDVKALVELVLAAVERNQDYATQTLFIQYEKQRRTDNLLMMSAMDGFYGLFSNDITPIKLIRNLGLKLADSSPLKNTVMKYAMGLS